MAKEKMITVDKGGMARIIPVSRLDEFKALGYVQLKPVKATAPAEEK